LAQNRNILCIASEDDTVRSSLGDLFESYEFDVHRHASLDDFVETAIERASSCLILDLPADHDKGAATLQLLRTELRGSPPVVLLTGRCDRRTRDQVRASGVACQLEKPVDSEWLVATVGTLIRHAQATPTAGRERSAPTLGAAFHDNRPVCEADR
jgi:FixJ family two-component response regulator